MSLETVVEDIRNEAEATAAQIREEAEAEADAIIEEAEADAAERLEQAEAEVEAQIEREREQARSSAGLRAKQERLAARRDLLGEVRERVEAAIVSLDDDRREEMTRTAIEAGLEEFEEGATIQLHGREEDEALLEALAKDYDDVSVGEPIDCLGGVVLEAEGARVRVNNTFDSVLEDVWEDRLKDISDRLFEE